MELLHSLPSPILSHASLSGMLGDYARPNDKISELIAKHELLALKRGLYLVADATHVPKELIANHLHGPSYVSRHWALSYYGLLTERVLSVTSMCLGRSRQIETVFGHFHYQAVPPAYYSMGIQSIKQGDVAFMMATPEKALADLLVSTKGLRIQSTSAMMEYLLDDLRLDEEDLLSLQASRIYEFAEQGYKTVLLNVLGQSIEGLAND